MVEEEEGKSGYPGLASAVCCVCRAGGGRWLDELREKAGHAAVIRLRDQDRHRIARIFSVAFIFA